MTTAAIVLAAGEGTRMKSKYPKVIHEVLGKPMVAWVVEACRKADVDEIILVTGNGAERVEALFAGCSDITIVKQTQRLGTGHAVAMAVEGASEIFNRCDSVLVLSGDTPLIETNTIKQLVAAQQTGSAVCLLTMEQDDPTGYGRIIRNDNRMVDRIVEQKDATASEQAVSECNSGTYCFDSAALRDYISKLDCNNAQGEYYLTDMVGIFNAAGLLVDALVIDDVTETVGVNSRLQLAQATTYMRRRINERHMAAGVTMMDPESVYIGPDVVIGRDSEILPGSILLGTTVIGEDCLIGPHTRMTDTVAGNGCVVDESVVIESILENNVSVGPRAYLRPLTHMCDDTKAGTSVEIKKSFIGRGSKVPHLSYVGDATLGEDVNLGAGTITCNYDGVAKHPTVVGDRAFVGSDTMLVAPLTVGSDTLIGAGSVITQDVPSGALALGRARQFVKEDYVIKPEQGNNL